jgi:hypothetical protein
LAACLPAAAGKDPALFHLTTPLPAASTDEALPSRAQPALMAVAHSEGEEGSGARSFTAAVRARLAPPDPGSWLGGVATAALPPRLVVAVHSNGTVVGVVARAAGSPALEWGVPAPGGKGTRAVEVVTAAAAVAGAWQMLADLARAWATATAPHAKDA